MDYQLNLISLSCHVPDEADLDEVYLKFQGERVWPVDQKFVRAKVGTNQLDVHLGRFNPDASLTIELWDYDTLSLNDHLGDFIIKADKLGTFSSELNAPGNSTVSYTLTWEVD